MAEYTRRQSSFADVVGSGGLLGPNARSLRISYLDNNCTYSEVKEVDSESTLYTVEYRLRNPNLRISRPGEDKYFGSATMHMFRSRIDVDVRGLGVRLKPTKDLLANFTYESMAMPGRTVTWESKQYYGYFNLVCVDEAQRVIAVITTQGWKQEGYGRFEMSADAYADEATREEVLLTGLTLTYQTNMSKTPAYAPKEPKAMGMGSAALPAAISPLASIH